MPTWFVSVANAGQISISKTVIEFVVIIRVFEAHQRLVPELDDAQQEVRMYVRPEDEGGEKQRACMCIFTLLIDNDDVFWEELLQHQQD
jgi:hypothetical protein